MARGCNESTADGVAIRSGVRFRIQEIREWSSSFSLGWGRGRVGDGVKA